MIIPLRISGGSQVMLILKKEGDDDVMTTGPGAGWRQNAVYRGSRNTCVKGTVWVCAGHAGIIQAFHFTSYRTPISNNAIY